MDERQAFKFGFLLRCADEGLSSDAIVERAEQAAVVGAHVKQAGGLVNALTSLGWLGLGASAVGGAAGGAGLASLMDTGGDPEAAKRQELVAAYQLQADRIRRSMAARRNRDAAAPRRPTLGAGGTQWRST